MERSFVQKVLPRVTNVHRVSPSSVEKGVAATSLFSPVKTVEPGRAAFPASRS
jgi:hypothetical protein